ncbi:hypothetical protein KAU11_09965, partial [Candidatus Babeliales bacterium]|nr:hypothetical protein [Candidatus Babeliales bacterium]
MPEGVFITNDYLLDVARGNVPGQEIIHKFGAGSVGTSLVPITQSGVYNTPTAVVSLEVVSDDVNDTSAGTGAQEVTLTIINASWERVDIVVELNGTTPVALGTDTFRLDRWSVTRSGTYATSAAGSHTGSLTVQVAGAGAVWSTIPSTPFPMAQSQIGAFTVPAGKKAYLVGKLVFTDTSKTADIYMFKRENADDVATPFSGIMKITEREVGVSGGFDHHFKVPKF